jgi:hypothetical protein
MEVCQMQALESTRPTSMYWEVQDAAQPNSAYWEVGATAE